MTKINRLKELEKLKQNYIILKSLVLKYKEIIEYNNQIEEFNREEKAKVKKLVLTKPFYGKNLQVG